MTIPTPKKPASKSKVIRVSDDTASRMDDCSNGIYASRGDFAVNAIREFSSDTILMFYDVIKNRKNSGPVEKQLAAVDVEIARRVNEIVAITPEVPPGTEETTQIMMYIPQGLDEQMDFVLTELPFIKNKTAYIRIAIQYKLEKISQEMIATRGFLEFDSLRDNTNENIYMSSIEKNFKKMVRSGEEFICRDDTD